MQNRILVLAIGNDITGDDRAAIAAADILIKKYADTDIDFEFVYGGGLELLDILEGRSRALILDTITTGLIPGTIINLDPNGLKADLSGSPHYIGLPEVIKLASVFDLEFPADIIILAIEIQFSSEITEELSGEIKDALPEYIRQASAIIDNWLVSSL